jgi:hypothetical protein
MARGVRQTVVEKQTQTYGQFQSQIRNMSKDDQDRYSSEGTPGWYRWQKRVAEQEERRAYREKAIKDFEAQVPQWGSYRGFSPEERDQQVRERSEVAHQWNEKRKKFRADLDKNYPAILL